MAELHALLLTDVVDSTRLTEELGDAHMAELWTAHNRLARDLLPRWRGREIDKTDGMLLLFDAIDDAVGYALAYHRALSAAQLPFKARAGIHVGPVTLRRNPADDVARGAKPIEIDGLALPITARVMSAALGTQTLLSADARLALGITPLRVVSHGHWRMHGIADPVELFEVGDADAPFSAPPDGTKVYRVMRQGDLWQPVREVRHSVPAERDSFVGRQEPLRTLARKLEEGARLVSVLGIGGTGKTRLVTRFAWTRLGDYPGGVWFCDLSQARTVNGIFFAVAQGLDVPLGETEPLVQLTHAIAGRGECLVILDNFEQVARHAEETLGWWLARAPQAHFIVTTREVLGIVGEDTLALAPLSSDDAATLFLRRADAVRSGTASGPDDLRAVCQLVKVLDGLPLAIELAAARVQVMGPQALLKRMHKRFNVLMSRSGRGDRQATLRAAFDWSWELLNRVEKTALAQLSVFEGGFTMDAVEAVLDLSGAGPALPPVDVIESLVQKSFVRRVGDERFDLLESVREYAAEHLRTEHRFPGSGPHAAAAALQSHWRHFAGLDERQAAAHRAIEANNLVAACRHATVAGDARAATGALLGAWAALRLTGPLKVASDLAERVCGLQGLHADDLALAHWVAGSALEMLGEVHLARRHFDEGLTGIGAGGSGRVRARLLLGLGSRQSRDGQLDDAQTSLSQAQQLASSEGDLSLQAFAMNALGRLMDHQARIAEARALYEAAIKLARQLGDRRLEGGLLGNLGGLHLDLGELDAAARHYEHALSMAHEVGDRRWEGNARCNLGLVCQERSQHALAQEQFEIALATAREIGYIRLEYGVLCNLGIALCLQHQFAQACDRLERAVDAANECADRRSEGQFRGYLATAYAHLGRLSEARECVSRGEWLLQEMSDRLSHALLICQRAEIETLGGDPAAARLTIAEASRIAAELGAGPDSELGRRLAGFQAQESVTAARR